MRRVFLSRNIEGALGADRVLIGGGGGVAATFVGSARALAKHGLTQPLRRIVLDLAAPTAAGGGECPALLLLRRPVLCALAPELVWQGGGAHGDLMSLAERRRTSAGGDHGIDHGIDHHQNWLRFPYVSAILRSHDLPPHPHLGWQVTASRADVAGRRP